MKFLRTGTTVLGVLIALITLSSISHAKSGCCSSHGGYNEGKTACADGSALSAKCGGSASSGSSCARLPCSLNNNRNLNNGTCAWRSIKTYDNSPGTYGSCCGDGNGRNLSKGTCAWRALQYNKTTSHMPRSYWTQERRDGNLSIILQENVALQAEHHFPMVVRRIQDGDTLEVQKAFEQKSSTLDLYGVYSLWTDARAIRTAKSCIRNVIKNKPLRFNEITKTAHGRSRSVVFADGVPINSLLIQQGCLGVDQRLCTEDFCQTWKQYEQDAKLAQVGAWAK